MKSSAAKSNGKQAPAATNQPLFYRNPYPIDATRHATAGLHKNAGFGFSAESNSVVLNIDDITEAARSYPIVFNSDEAAPLPVAILALGERNSFIDAAGQWDAAHYIPSYIRRYPFGLAKIPNSEELILCIDEDAPHFAAENADLRLFDGDKPTQMTQEALQFCALFQKANDASVAFGKALKDAGLLFAQNLEIKNREGTVRTIENLQMIHPERWHNFAKKNASAWEEKGYLTAVVMILASQVNWKYLAARP